MGIYKVQANGKAPQGLSVGDTVVTGGGTYLIIGVNSDGSYRSRLTDSAQTIYNYRGGYDTVAGSGGSALPAAAVPSRHTTAQTGVTAAAAPAAPAEEAYRQLLAQLSADSYTPAVTAAAPAQPMSFAQALELADSVMAPQYREAYQQSAIAAAQRLEQAGLYDTVYGQALAAEAERDVTQDMNAAIYALALQLSEASADQAQAVLELAVKEQQFGAEYSAGQKNTALKYLLALLERQDKIDAAAQAQA